MERDLLVEVDETPLPWVIKEPNLESNWCRDDKRTAKSFLSVMSRRVQEGIKLRSTPNRFQGWKGRKPMCQPSAPPSSTKINGLKSWKPWKSAQEEPLPGTLGFSFPGSVLYPRHHFCSHPFSHPISRPRWTQPDFSLGFTPPIVVANHSMIPRGVPFWHFLAWGDRLAIKPSMWTTLSFYHSSWNLIPAGPRFCWRTPFGNQFIHVI